jgi:transposase
VERKKKSDQGIPPSPNHRPPKINEDQLRIVKEFIHQREVDEKNPPEPEEVCAFIQTTFDITYHRN